MSYLETSKIRARLLPYCQGCGIDIGCQDDKIRPEAIGIDKKPYNGVNIVGDALITSRLFHSKFLSFDYVYSSHCLEDIEDHMAALADWISLLRSGGTLVLQVPHPKLYKGRNPDHRHPGWTPDELKAMARHFRLNVIEAFADDVPKENRYSSVLVARKP